MNIDKADIKKTLAVIAEHSKKIETDGKGDAQRLGVAVNLLAAILDGQEDRLCKLEEAAHLPYSR